MQISNTPGVGGVFTSYVTQSDLDALTINDLAAQTTNYDCQGYKLTNLGAPVDPADVATKQYVDDVSAISEGIANAVTVTSGLTANQTELTNGTTPINMNS